MLRAGLGERSDGRWAARQVGVSAPRQQGKTMLIVARVLAGLLLFDERVIIVSAHRQDTARETFFRLVQIIEDNPSLLERVDFIARSEMREFIRMKSGQEVRFKARSAGSGRGFSYDCLMLDEAQILGSAAWSAILPTMSARPNPQVWLMGTPPTENDDGDVFGRFRGAGIKGVESRIAYLEWSAAPGDDFDDPQVWAKANPAFGSRISHEAVATERATMLDSQFGMERLGMWAEEVAGEVALDLAAWSKVALTAVPEEWPLAALGVDMHPVSGRLYVAPAAFGPGPPLVHVELLDRDILAGGVDAAVEWIVSRVGRRLPVVMPADSAATVLHAPLVARKVKVYVLNLTEQGQASAAFERAVSADKTVSHFVDPLLDQAVDESTREQHRAAGQWRFGRVGELHGAPLWAVTAAHFGAVKWSKRRGVASDRDSVRSGRESASRSSSSREAASV